MKKLAAAALICCCAAACHAADVKTNYDTTVDFSQFKSYAWMTPRGVTGVDDPAALDQTVKASVEVELAKRGFVMNAAAPDFMIGYHAVVEPKVEEFILDTRYDDMSDAFYDRVAPYAGPAGQKRTEVYYEGTLVLDIADARTKNLVWRSSMEGRVNKKLRPAEKQKRIDKGVSQMLSQFPPRKKK
jgi:hypothetical protein